MCLFGEVAAFQVLAVQTGHWQAWHENLVLQVTLFFQKVFFFSVERFVFCRQMPYQKQPSPSIITIKGGVFYYQMGQYLEGTRCDLRLIV